MNETGRGEMKHEQEASRLERLAAAGMLGGALMILLGIRAGDEQAEAIEKAIAQLNDSHETTASLSPEDVQKLDETLATISTLIHRDAQEK